jgi:signal transduction histidine kinase
MRLVANEPRRHRLAYRIALVAVWSAALGALVAALTAIATVDQLLAEQADQRLNGALVELAGELDEDRGKPAARWLSRTIADENGEISASGIRLSVFDGHSELAGESLAPPPAAASCSTHGAVGQRIRGCAQRYGPWLLVAEQASDTGRLRWIYVVAALGAMILGGGTGALLSRGLAQWAARPLAILARGLRASQATGARNAELNTPSSCEDVEAVRVALLDRTEQTQLLLEQANRFAADAAHELRTPLSTLRAELDLLREDTLGPKEPLENASKRVSRLADLVERLLVLAMPGDRLSPGFEAVAMSDVVEEVAEELSESDRSVLRLRLKTEGLVRGDAELLHSLTSNAVNNALRFRAEQTITITLTETEAAEVVLEVQDHGPGIAAELRERAFQPFHRISPHVGSGHGLGLALISHIAQVHGGTARFVDVAQGACLRVCLPGWTPPP